MPGEPETQPLAMSTARSKPATVVRRRRSRSRSRGDDDEEDERRRRPRLGPQCSSPASIQPQQRCLMPVGVALVDLRRDLRAETGQSLNMAQGVQSQATQDNQLDRQQRELWQAYDWPHLKYWVDVPVSAGPGALRLPDRHAVRSDQLRLLARMEGGTRWRRCVRRRTGSIRSPGMPSPGTPLRWGNKVVVDPIAAS